jgi:hypothetical protein
VRRVGSLLLALAVLLMLSGCAKWLPGRKAPEASPPASEAEKPVATVSAAALLPSKDQHLAFLVTDRGKEPVTINEELIREGDRIVAVYGGVPYATWLLRDDGLWRQDPKGGGALLRYLPKELRDGDAWVQESAGASVWFRVTKARSACPTLPGDARPEQCWWLTVVNRGEQTELLFASGLGPIYAYDENWQDPSASFVKQAAEIGPGKLAGGARSQYIAKAPATTSQPAEAKAATAAEFQAELARLQPKESRPLDLNGDGQLETVRGTLESWTASPVLVFREDGSTLAHLEPAQGQMRVRVVQVKGRPLLLYESGQPDAPHELRVLRAVATQFIAGTDEWSMGGFEGMVNFTTASRVIIADDGLLTADWDMGDPARHTWVRRWQVGEQGLEPRDRQFRPQGSSLTYPADPQGVLAAAIFAKLHHLDSELPLYFTTSDVTAPLTGDRRIGEPEPGGTPTVQMGVVTPPGPSEFAAKVKPAPLGPDYTTGFAAGWGGYQWGALAWGSVTFGPANGRTVITRLTIDGYKFSGD